ncbi:hypothetical protein BC828DRAFT_372440 [Blastocladiella britannica]|nr:hypothetical protein BC828DRAFT_372440 [Blastocladiella britannica]
MAAPSSPYAVKSRLHQTPSTTAAAISLPAVVVAQQGRSAPLDPTVPRGAGAFSDFYDDPSSAVSSATAVQSDGSSGTMLHGSQQQQETEEHSYVANSNFPITTALGTGRKRPPSPNSPMRRVSQLGSAQTAPIHPLSPTVADPSDPFSLASPTAVGATAEFSQGGGETWAAPRRSIVALQQQQQQQQQRGMRQQQPLAGHESDGFVIVDNGRRPSNHFAVSGSISGSGGDLDRTIHASSAAQGWHTAAQQQQQPTYSGTAATLEGTRRMSTMSALFKTLSRESLLREAVSASTASTAAAASGPRSSASQAFHVGSASSLVSDNGLRSSRGSVTSSVSTMRSGQFAIPYTAFIIAGSDGSGNGPTAGQQQRQPHHHPPSSSSPSQSVSGSDQHHMTTSAFPSSGWSTAAVGAGNGFPLSASSRDRRRSSSPARDFVRNYLKSTATPNSMASATAVPSTSSSEPFATVAAGAAALSAQKLMAMTSTVVHTLRSNGSSHSMTASPSVGGIHASATMSSLSSSSSITTGGRPVGSSLLGGGGSGIVPRSRHGSLAMATHLDGIDDDSRTDLSLPSEQRHPDRRGSATPESSAVANDQHHHHQSGSIVTAKLTGLSSSSSSSLRDRVTNDGWAAQTDSLLLSMDMLLQDTRALLGEIGHDLDAADAAQLDLGVKLGAACTDVRALALWETQSARAAIVYMASSDRAAASISRGLMAPVSAVSACSAPDLSLP